MAERGKFSFRHLERGASLATKDLISGGLGAVGGGYLLEMMRGMLVHPSYVSLNPSAPALLDHGNLFNVLSHMGNIPEGFGLAAVGYAVADFAFPNEPYSWKKALAVGMSALTVGGILEMIRPGQTPDINDIWVILPAIALFAGWRRLLFSTDYTIQSPKKKRSRK